jgi:hypothetical protein
MSPLTELIGGAKVYGWGKLIETGPFESIATVTLSSNETTITFSSIPATFTHLQIRATALGDSVSGKDVLVRFNSDTASNYNWHRLYGNGTSGLGQGSATTTAMYYAADAVRTLYPATAIIDILDYTNTNKYKTMRNLSGFEQNGAGTIAYWSGLWRNTDAITTVTISVTTDNLAQYSSFALYGIRSA